MTLRKTFAATTMATLVLGSVLAPTVLAKPHRGNAKSYSQTYYVSKKSIYLNGKLVSEPVGIVARDPNTNQPTTYMPIWYVFQALKSVGVQYKWDGHNLNIIPPDGMPVTLSNLHPGTEPIHLAVNGVLIDTAKRIVARDPYSHVFTTYIPIFYVQYVLKHIGVTSIWNGHRWSMTTKPIAPSTPGSSSAPTLKTLSVSAQASVVGTGEKDQLNVVGTYSDGSTKTMSPDQLKWTTSNSNSVFISPSDAFVATSPGTYTLTATDGGVAASVQIEVYGSTAAIQLSANGQLVANGSSTETVTIKAVDANGVQNSKENGTVVVSADEPWLVSGQANGQSTLASSVPVQLKNGVGTVSIQAPTAPGRTIQLTPSGLSDAQSGTSVRYGTAAITSVPQQATSLSIQPESSNPYLVANLSGNSVTFDVQVKDQVGQPMVSGTYPFNIAVSGPASYSGSTTGVVQGSAPAKVTINSEQGQTGAVTVTVSGNALTSASATVQAVISTTASKIAATSTDGTSGFAEGSKVTYNLTAEDANGVPTSFPTTPLTVLVTDAKGQPATNIQVNGVTMTTSGTALGNAQTLTLDDLAQAPDAGTYTVTLRDSSGKTWATFPVQETAAAASKLDLTSASSELLLTNASTTVTVHYTDAYGNSATAPTGIATVKLTATGGQGTATINGADATQGVPVPIDANGQSTVTFRAQPYDGSVWKITASDGKLTSDQLPISIVSTVVNQTTVSIKDGVTGSTTQATAGDPLQITFGALDTYNNAYNGNDTFTATVQAGALRGVTGGVTSNGTTTVTGSLAALNSDFAKAQAATAQTLTIKLADDTVQSARQGAANLSIVPGKFQGFAVFNGQNQAITAGNPLQLTTGNPTEVWVRPVDAYDNPIGATPGTYTVNLASNGGGSFRVSPSGADMTQISMPIGSASEPVYYVNQNGSYVLTASIPKSSS